MKERLINTRFWSDGFVREKLNPLDRYLYLYFLTNEKTNISGIYELPKSVMSWETGIEENTLSDMLVRLKGKVEYLDGWVILVNFLKYQRTASESVIIGIQKSLKEAPKHVVDYAFSIGYGDDTPIIPPSSHISESESESKSEYKLELEKLSNDSVPSKTLKEYRNLRRKQQGKEPMAENKATEKQKAFLKRMRSLDYFHAKGIENKFEYLSEEDESANRKFQGIARTFEKRYGDDYKKVIDWWFSGDNAWCDYHPSNFFSVSNWMKYDNKNNQFKKPQNWGILE